MKIEDLVLTIEQMQRLKDLGVEVKEPSIWWASQCKDTRGNEIKKRKWFVTVDNSAQTCGFAKWEFVATLTLQEILEMLPKSIVSNEYWYALYVDYEYRNISYSYKNGDELSAEETFAIEGDSSNFLLQAAYEALCWCAENGYLNTK